MRWFSKAFLNVFAVLAAVSVLSGTALAVEITLPNYGQYGTHLTNTEAINAYLFWFDDSGVVAGDVNMSGQYSFEAAEWWVADTDNDSYLFLKGSAITPDTGEFYIAFDGLAATRDYAGFRVEYAQILNGQLQDAGTFYRTTRKWVALDEFTHGDDIAAAVPAPAAIWLLGGGLVGLLGWRKLS